jgi:hypothetical protein
LLPSPQASASAYGLSGDIIGYLAHEPFACAEDVATTLGIPVGVDARLRVPTVDAADRMRGVGFALTTIRHILRK